MPRQHLLAFGSNPFGKCCPGITDIIVRHPVDILPVLLKGNDCPIDEVKVMCGTWDRTLIRLRESELPTTKLVCDYIQPCISEFTGNSQYYALGFQEDAAESLTARRIQADAIDGYFGLKDIRSMLNADGALAASQLTLLESGSAIGIATRDEASSGLPGCVYAETIADLQGDPTSCLYSLPGPPGTAYRIASGLSHAILFSQSPNSSFNAILGLGDNRHRAAMPRTEECKQPINTLARPAMIEALCGIDISGVSAGGYRSAAWTEDGEAWIWGKGIEGLSDLDLPDSAHEADEAGGGRIAQIAVGDDYEFVLSSDGILWTRGQSAYSVDWGHITCLLVQIVPSDSLGQLGILGDTELKDFVAHPFFVAKEGGRLVPRYRVRTVECKRSSTFVFCDSYDP